MWLVYKELSQCLRQREPSSSMPAFLEKHSLRVEWYHYNETFGLTQFCGHSLPSCDPDQSPLGVEGTRSWRLKFARIRDSKHRLSFVKTQSSSLKSFAGIHSSGNACEMHFKLLAPSLHGKVGPPHDSSLSPRDIDPLTARQARSNA